jgi:8-oxo-dGTP pyrophosphatase MutT (NUDIX family)
MSADDNPTATARAEIEQVDSKSVYRNRWMHVREDTVRRADGSPGLFGIVEKNDFAVIVALHEGALVMVEQYRYPVQRRCWEFPQGAWDKGHDPLALAKTELREETGMVADTIVHAGRLFLASGFCTQAYDVYFATGLTQGESALEVEEQGLIARLVPLAQVEADIGAGVIMDASTVAAFGLLRLKKLL